MSLSLSLAKNEIEVDQYLLGANQIVLDTFFPFFWPPPLINLTSFKYLIIDFKPTLH